MQYWLMKSEPTAFSIDHLKQCPNSTDHWDGVRNYQARNMMRDDMCVGDLAFFYHSNCTVPGIVGVMHIVKSAYPDFTAVDPNNAHFDEKSSPDNPRWFMVDVKFQTKFKNMIPLSEIKTNPALRNLALVKKGNRLSIMPVSSEEWSALLAMVK
jgi:predicted RNA-binding protein with PUA-like domain